MALSIIAVLDNSLAAKLSAIQEILQHAAGGVGISELYYCEGVMGRMPESTSSLISDGYYLPPDDDAKAFVTYRNYTNAYLWLINELYPSNSDQARTISNLPGFSRARPASLNEAEVANQLLGAWSTELLMAESLRVSSPVAIRYANVWSPVQAYYAVFSAGIAWLRSIGDQATAHKTVGSVLTSELQRTNLSIAPWSAACNGCSILSNETYSNVPSDADYGVSNLRIPRDQASAWGLVGKSLKTTRNEQLLDSFNGWLKGQKTSAGKPRKNVPANVKNQIGTRFPSTSWLHLLYRLRIRANYKEADSFAVGAMDHSEARAFYDSQLQLTSRNLFLIECLIVGVMGIDFLNNTLGALPEQSAPVKGRWREVSSLFSA